MSRLVSALVLSLATLAALPARAGEGFVIGLEPVTGTWDAPAQTVFETSCANNQCLHPGTIAAFTSPIDGQRRQGLNLHLGWNIKGHAAVEAVLHSSTWEPFSQSRGGAGMAGLRATWFPAQLFFEGEKRVWDAGLELGGGYSIAGGPSFGMDGYYLAFGVLGEWYPAPWFSLGLGYRYLSNAWSSFILNFNHNQRWDTPGFTAGYSTFFLAFNFHLTGASE